MIYSTFSKRFFKNLLPAIILFGFLTVSSETFAQKTRDSGGSASGYIPQPCPVSFKRNNGQGTCGGDSQIRITFAEMPTETPSLTDITYRAPDGTTYQVTNVFLPVTGDLVSKNKPYYSFCLTGSIPAPGNSQGNIPPASKLVLEITFPGGQVCHTEVEEL